MANKPTQPVFPLGLAAEEQSTLAGVLNTGTIEHGPDAVLTLPEGNASTGLPSSVRYNADSDKFEGFYENGGWLPLGGGGIRWEVLPHASTATLTEGRGYLINNTTGASTVVLPSPTRIGDSVTICDAYGKFATYPLTVSPSGNNLYGSTEDMAITTDNVSATFTWSGPEQGWVITSGVGLGQGRVYSREIFTKILASETSSIALNTPPTIVDVYADGKRLAESKYSLDGNVIAFSPSLPASTELQVIEYTPIQLGIGDGSGSSTITWVYNGGSAIGGETEITLDVVVDDVPAIDINGSRQYKNLGFTFDPLTSKITLAQELEPEDEVVVIINGTPNIYNQIDYTLREVARTTNVKDTEVVYFSVGAALSGYKVIYDKETQRAYPLPADIAPGTTAVSLSSSAVLVHSAGSVDLGALAVSREEYVTLSGTFDTGVTVNTKNELVVFTDGKYRWDGVLPKEVPAGSTPTTTGGEGAGKWLSVGEITTRRWVSEKFQVGEISKVGSFTTGGTATAWKSALLYEGNGIYYTPVSGTLSANAGSSPDSNWRAVGLLRGYPINDIRNWSTNISPTETNDITNNTAAIQFMIDSLGAGSTIVFPAGFTTVVNRLDIKYPDMTICGGGVIDGTIRVCRETFATSSNIYMNCTIKDVLFSTSRGLTDAIQLAYCRMGTITNIADFRGYTNAIHILNNTAVGGTTANALGQMVNRWIVSNCHYGKDGTNTVGRFIYVEASEGMTFPIADWIVKGNEGHATLDHIVITTVDGLTASDNIMFFPGYQAANATKRSHIRIETGGTWIQIHDNKFFESGGTSVYLNGVTRFSLHDNLYAFGAQRVPAPQIVLAGTPLAGDYFTQGVIHDETIIFPGGEGVSIGAKSGRLKIHSINVQNPSSPKYYYGTAPQPEAQGVIVDSDTLAVEVYNCTVREGNNTLPAVIDNLYRDNVIDGISGGTGFSRASTLKTLTITSATSAIDARLWDAVEVSVTSSFGLTTIKNAGPTKMLTITNTGSSNFNIAHSATLRLAGSTTATLTPGSTITLRVATGGNATEVSRAIL